MTQSRGIYAKRNSPPAERLALYSVRRANGCLEWTGPRDPKKYGYISHKGKRIYVHRLTWTLAKGPIPPGKCVLHRCDNPPCREIDHLFCGTRAENNADRDAKNRQSRGDVHAQKGSRHHQAKLTEADVVAIRAAPGSHEAVAAQYGVSSSLISMIRSRRIWRHI